MTAQAERPGRAIAAAYLRATAVHDPAELVPDDEAREFFARAFKLAAAQRFPEGTPLAEITVMVARVAAAHRNVRLPRREAEMLIRDALGEDVPVGGIPADQAMTIHVVFFTTFIDDMALTDEELDELIGRA